MQEATSRPVVFHRSRTVRNEQEHSQPLLNEQQSDDHVSLLVALGSAHDFDTYDGLSEEEAARRLVAFGPNAIPTEKKHIGIRILFTFLKPMPVFLFIVGVVCAVLRDWVAFVVVMGLTLLNGFVTLYEEMKSERAIEALRQSLGVDAHVKRSGVWLVVPAEMLVPGDVVTVKLGDMIPADCLLQKGRDLELDQSVVTGESLPVQRGTKELAFSGTLVVSGNMTAVVVATGVNSVFGKTAQLMREPKTQTHLQKFTFNIALAITITALVLSIVLVIVKVTTTSTPPILVIQRALVLLVAAVPIAIAVVVTTSLALGSRELAMVGIITARLNAIEQLAGMDAALCDKTGTLTQNRLKLTDPILREGVSEAEILMFAALASSPDAPDPIDKVIGERLGLASASMARNFEVRDYVPFDPVKKRACATVWHKTQKRTYQVVKGAPHKVVEHCSFGPQDSANVMGVVQMLAKRGLRGLGVAIQPEGEGWRYLGTLAMIDALRPEAPQVVKELADYGVEVKMVTGDGLDIGRETCRLLGMYTNAVDRQEMMRILESPIGDWSRARLDEIDAFAEVFPEDKFDIVALYQRHGYTVGMTGDGVNDCPALRKADIGIAVQGAADAARLAADIVLTRADTTVLSDAVLVSRMIFERIRNYLFYRINCTSVVLFWTFSSELFFNFTMPALVFVAIAGFNNFVILSIAFDHIEPEHEPLYWRYSALVPTSLFQAILSCLEVYFCFSLANNSLLLFSFFMTPGQIRTVVFMDLIICMQTSIFVLRTRGFFFSPRAPRPGGYVLAAVLTLSFVATIISVYWPFGGGLEPIRWNDAGMVWLIIIVFLLLKDVVKVLVNYIMRELSPNQQKMLPKLKTLKPYQTGEFEEIEMTPVSDDRERVSVLVHRSH